MNVRTISKQQREGWKEQVKKAPPEAKPSSNIEPYGETLKLADKFKKFLENLQNMDDIFGMPAEIYVPSTGKYCDA